MDHDFEGCHHSQKSKIIDDPWYGRCHTDVTECHYKPVPGHCSQDVNSPVPSFDRHASDVTEHLHSRHSSPLSRVENYYGKVNTDVTQHLHGKAPKFVDPHGGELEPYFGVQVTDVTDYKISPIQSIEGPNLTEYMHPLGKHRPFPLSQMFYHGGSRPRSRSGSPYTRKESSPARQPRHQCPPASTSPSKGYDLPCTAIAPPPPLQRNRSKSPPDRSRCPKGGEHSPPRSGSPTHCEKPCHRSRSPPKSSPSHCHQQYIPSPFLNCGRACQLCPPCPACQELLNSSYGKELLTATHGGDHGARRYCQFHGNSPCPVQAGLPCYGMRPWPSSGH